MPYEYSNYFNTSSLMYLAVAEIRISNYDITRRTNLQNINYHNYLLSNRSLNLLSNSSLIVIY